MKKCKYADSYKAERPPKCHCETCCQKWNEKQLKMAKLAMSSLAEILTVDK